MCISTNSPLTFTGGAPLPYQEEHAACELPLRVTASPSPSRMTATASSFMDIPTQQDDVSMDRIIDEASTTAASCCGDPTDLDVSPAPRKRLRTLNKDLPLSLLQNRSTPPNPKERFAAFIAILLRQLDGHQQQHKENYKLSIQAKAMISECLRRAEMKDPHFLPMEQNMSERLHGLVGDYHWNCAQAHLQYYLAQQQQQQQDGISICPKAMTDLSLEDTSSTSSSSTTSSLTSQPPLSSSSTPALLTNLSFGVSLFPLPPR